MMEKIMGFFGLEGDSIIEDSSETAVINRKEKNQNNKIINLHSQKNIKVILFEPNSYEESQTLADHLCSYRSVIVSLKHLEPNQARRIVDFLSGCVYALKGNIKKIGDSVFLCTPSNVDILGDISEIIDIE